MMISRKVKMTVSRPKSIALRVVMPAVVAESVDSKQQIGKYQHHPQPTSFSQSSATENVHFATVNLLNSGVTLFG